MGDLNEIVPDLESECTGKGAHRRCIVLGDLDETTREPIGVTVTCDLDYLEYLPIPTPSQARACALGERRVHARGLRLVFHGTHEWTNPNNGHRCVDFVFGF